MNDEQDLKRYHWLRENGASILGDEQEVELPGSKQVKMATVWRSMETLDAKIDELMASECTSAGTSDG